MAEDLTEMVQLYDYQEDAVLDVDAALARHDSVVLQMPTGAGKTVTAAEIVCRASADGPVWFICHRREIIRQASKAFSALGIEHDVIAPNPAGMGLGSGYSPGAPIKIASVQTLAMRKGLEPPLLAVWDECQHVAAKTWAGLKERMPGTKHIGLTATPERLDGKGLSEWFGAMVTGPAIQALIDRGRLSPVRFFAPSQPDLTEARLSMGDYRKQDADKVMNTPVLIGNAVDEYKRHADGSRAIVFATSISASKRIVERFKDAGIPATHVDGTTPLDDRDAAVSDLAAGRIKVLSNVEVFTEGVDVPAVDTVILMRPTRSLALYLQMVGRGMRTAPGKDRLTVFDHAGLVYEHGLPDRFAWDWSLDGGARKRRIAVARKNGEVIRRCPECACAHAVAATCPECGFAYPTGREVGEWDGVLQETAFPKIGLLTTSQFAAKIGKRRGTVANWKKRGIPVDENGLIYEQEAMMWVEENTKKTPSDGYMLSAEFCKSIGVSTSMGTRWIIRGIPSNEHGHIKIPDGFEWVQRNSRSEKAAPLKAKRSGVSTMAEMERIIGRSGPFIKSLIARGMPTVGVGTRRMIPTRKGLEWVRDNTDIQIPPEAWPKDGPDE